MPRPPRLLLSQSYYHIMTRGNNKKIVFKKADDYLYYLHLIEKYKKELPFNLFHYCLMPTHVHQLVRTKDAKDFSVYMKKINLAYFHYYRQHYGWIGHFWQDRFKSQPIGKDSYFIQCGKYIEENPVRKELVINPEDYPYSSYRFYANGEKNDLLTEDILYQDLGKNKLERMKKYKKLMIDEVILESYKKPIWGSDYQRYHEQRKVSYNLQK